MPKLEQKGGNLFHPAGADCYPSPGCAVEVVEDEEVDIQWEVMEPHLTQQYWTTLRHIPRSEGKCCTPAPYGEDQETHPRPTEDVEHIQEMQPTQEVQPHPADTPEEKETQPIQQIQPLTTDTPEEKEMPITAKREIQLGPTKQEENPTELTLEVLQTPGQTSGKTWMETPAGCLEQPSDVSTVPPEDEEYHKALSAPKEEPEAEQHYESLSAPKEEPEEEQHYKLLSAAKGEPKEEQRYELLSAPNEEPEEEQHYELLSAPNEEPEEEQHYKSLSAPKEEPEAEAKPVTQCRREPLCLHGAEGFKNGVIAEHELEDSEVMVLEMGRCTDKRVGCSPLTRKLVEPDGQQISAEHQRPHKWFGPVPGGGGDERAQDSLGGTPSHPPDVGRLLRSCSIELVNTLHLQRLAGWQRPLHVCRECGKIFSRKKFLRRHRRFHSGERPYKCTQCPKMFTLRRKLRWHKRLHSGERPHGCVHCSKRFRLKPNLMIHLRFHTGEKPFSCTICGKRYRDHKNLERHLVVHFGAG